LKRIVSHLALAPHNVGVVPLGHAFQDLIDVTLLDPMRLGVGAQLIPILLQIVLEALGARYATGLQAPQNGLHATVNEGADLTFDAGDVGDGLIERGGAKPVNPRATAECGQGRHPHLDQTDLQRERVDRIRNLRNAILLVLDAAGDLPQQREFVGTGLLGPPHGGHRLTEAPHFTRIGDEIVGQRLRDEFLPLVQEILDLSDATILRTDGVEIRREIPADAPVQPRFIARDPRQSLAQCRRVFLGGAQLKLEIIPGFFRRQDAEGRSCTCELRLLLFDGRQILLQCFARKHHVGLVPQKLERRF
jgi:hypothetical protein